MALVTQDLGSSRGRVRIFVAVVALFALALGLRLAHLDRGLRHQPDYDERVFVENAVEMGNRGDWDHRFYEYPGLLIWLLRILFSAVDAEGAEAYLAARTLMALASALTVPLVFVVVSRRVSSRAGLGVALLLALSPVDIETVHVLRPDTMIAPLLFAALAAQGGEKGGRPWLAWGLATTATAIKFSAALVFVPLMASALFNLGMKRSRIAALSLWSLVLFALLSPYTFLGGGQSLSGMGTQLDYHYAGPPSASFLSLLWHFVSDILSRGLSAPALALAAWGVVVGLRGRSGWLLGWILFPLFWLLVFSSTGVRRDRFLVPVLGALCLLAAVGLEDLWKRARPLGFALLVLALGSVGIATGRYISSLAHPLAMDQALDWTRRTPGVKAVGTTLEGIGALDAGDPEIVMLRGFRGDPFIAAQFDTLILSAEAPSPRGFALAVLLKPESCCDDGALAIHRALVPRAFHAIDLGRAVVKSTAPERDEKLHDGQVSTRWRADSPDAVIEVEWAALVEPTRLEIAYGNVPPDRELRVTLSDDQGAIEAHSLRPPLAVQRLRGRDVSQVFAWPARPTRRLRLALSGPVPMRIGELRVFASAR